MNTSQPANCRNYYVDEAGDTTLFAKGGKVLVGTDNCSKCFMLGAASIPDTEATAKALNGLRAELIADPYLAKIPSMDPTAGKTAKFFHAKDDCPEVRREVFKVIKSLDVLVSVAIRRKQVLVDIGLQARKVGTRALIGPNDLYDDLVSKLFRPGHLFFADHHHITFARRGNKPRIQALARAIENAKAWGRDLASFQDKPFTVTASEPSECCGLQVVDYCLWALQRMYERKEDRYYEFVREKFDLIMDLDDPSAVSGVWYYQNKQLSQEKIKAL